MSNSLSGIDIPASGSGDLFMKKLEQGENRFAFLQHQLQDMYGGLRMKINQCE